MGKLDELESGLLHLIDDPPPAIADASSATDDILEQMCGEVIRLADTMLEELDRGGGSGGDGGDGVAVRCVMLHTLGKLRPETLAHFSEGIAAMLGDDSAKVRSFALNTLGKLNTHALMQHSDQIYYMIVNDTCSSVRRLAIEISKELHLSPIDCHGLKRSVEEGEYPWTKRNNNRVVIGSTLIDLTPLPDNDTWLRDTAADSDTELGSLAAVLGEELPSLDPHCQEGGCPSPLTLPDRHECA